MYASVLFRFIMLNCKQMMMPYRSTDRWRRYLQYSHFTPLVWVLFRPNAGQCQLKTCRLRPHYCGRISQHLSWAQTCVLSTSPSHMPYWYCLQCPNYVCMSNVPLCHHPQSGGWFKSWNYSHWFKSRLKLWFLSKESRFKSQQSVHFRHPFTQIIIQHQHMYCLKVF